jgi:flagellin
MIQAQRTFDKAAESIASGLSQYVNPADSYVASGIDSTIRSAKVAIANAENGFNFTSVAEGALESVTGNLQRIRELSIQASNGIYSESQISAMQAEIDQNIHQIQQTLGNATFNGKATLNAVTPENPDVAPAVDFMVGTSSTEMITYDPNIALDSFNFDVTTPDNAAATLAQVDTMLNAVNSKRGEIGAIQTSFEGAISMQNNNILSYASSLSSIQDTDYVTAIMDFKKSQFTMEAMAKVMKTVMNSQSYILDLIK